MKINKDRCKGCGLCLLVCPVNAIELDSRNHKWDKVANINNNKCIGCKNCYLVCPDLAIKED